MGLTNYAYCWNYFPLLPHADSLLNMGSYNAVGDSFGVTSQATCLCVWLMGLVFKGCLCLQPGNPRSIEPVLCTNKSGGVVVSIFSISPKFPLIYVGGVHNKMHLN